MEELQRLKSYVERKEEILEMLPDNHNSNSWSNKQLRRSRTVLKKLAKEKEVEI